MALGPGAVLVDLLVAVIWAAGAAVLLLLSVFFSIIGGWTAVGAALAGVVSSIALVVWRARRRVPRAAGASGSWAASGRRYMLTAFGIAVVAAAAALAGNVLAVRRPAQAKIAADFRAHRSDFESLRDMVLADRLTGVLHGGDEFAREPLMFRAPGALGLPAARVALYRERMKAAGTPRIDVWSDGSVRFSVASWGAANHGWRIDVIWSKAAPAPLLPTIDGFPNFAGAKASEWAYSALGDDWYVGIVW